MLRHENRLNERQRKFLRTMREQPATLEAVVKAHGIVAWMLCRWLRKPVFRDALAGVLKEIRVQGRLELRLAARKARHDLAQMVSGQLPSIPEHRQTCLETIKVEQREPKRRKTLSARAKREKIPPPESIPQMHPGYSPQRAAELVEELKALQADPTPDEPDEPVNEVAPAS